MAMQEDENLDIEGMVNEFEHKLDRLKVLYEQYFMGIEKREPLVPLKDVVRTLRALEQVKIRNTGLRFRYRNLVQRFNVYRTYWHRILRSIENGTYHRDVARASRNLARQGITLSAPVKQSAAEIEKAITTALKGAPSPADKAPAESPLHSAAPAPVAPTPSVPKAAAPTAASSDPSINIDDEVYSSRYAETSPPGRSRPTLPASCSESRPPPPPASCSESRPPPPPSHEPATKRTGQQVASKPPQGSSGATLSETEIQSIYRRFIKAKKMCGEDVSSIKYETLAKSVKQQLPKIQQQHPGQHVEFQVVIRGGKAVIRAAPKDKGSS